MSDNQEGPPSEAALRAQAREGSGTTGNKIVDEAKRRFQRASEWEAPARQRFIEDLKFAYGDADNGYQWPNAIRRSRDIDSKPCLTMNIIRQHNLMIINERKKNKSEVNIVATGGGATAETAQVMRDIVSDIQYSSRAQSAYSVAAEFQVYGGIGWWRLGTQYCGPDTFDQEIVVLPINDPLTVYCDPDAKQKDKSDMKWAFVFDDVPREEFEETYPELKDKAGLSPMGVGSGDDDWVTKDHVRVCEYWRKVPKRDWLLNFKDPNTGERKNIRQSQLPANARKAVRGDEMTKRREIWVEEVEWYLIVGDDIADETVWPGADIPLLCVLGEETVIEGILDRKGHTRAMKDGQRMYNYNASAQVEVVALQTKTPWTGSAESIEEFEQEWNNANTANKAFMPFNHLDSNGDPIPIQALPRRLDPPTAGPAFEAGMQTAFNQVMMVSGQWQNQMGMMGNERTGEAIARRQDQGDTATFHFQDHFELALMNTGRQLIDLIPKVYDTKRVMVLQDQGGEDYQLEVDPAAAQAYQAAKDEQGKVVRQVFNPSVGRYAVRAVPGQAFGTRRQETVQALTLILTQAPALTGIIGDLLLSAMDFKEAKEAANRLRHMVPPQALGQGPTPNEQKLMDQNMALQSAVREAMQKLGKDQLKLVGKSEMRDIDIYKAETDRFKALADAAMLDPAEMQKVVEQLVQEAAQTHLTPLLQANADAITDSDVGKEGAESGPIAPEENAPMPGARRAPDGEWYLSDPTRRGKYMRVAPLAQERNPRGIISNA